MMKLYHHAETQKIENSTTTIFRPNFLVKLEKAQILPLKLSLHIIVSCITVFTVMLKTLRQSPTPWQSVFTQPLLI